MADEKSKSDDLIPQADQQAHKNIAEHEGKEGAQAKIINEQAAEKRKKD